MLRYMENAPKFLSENAAESLDNNIIIQYLKD